MSTVKHPEEKKILSLTRDRRNVYGESTKGTRVGIPKSKQKSKQKARRDVVEVLSTLKGPSDQLDVDAAEAEAKDRVVAGKRNVFKKRPDAPLAAVVLRRRQVSGSRASPEWRFRKRRSPQFELWARRTSVASRRSKISPCE